MRDSTNLSACRSHSNLLRTIKSNLFGLSLRFHDKCMLWSAMTMAFFGLLRASEYTCKNVSSYDPETDLCVTDVICNDHDAFVNVKASETDIYRLATSIRLVANQSILCPVTALEQYLRIRTRRAGPLFQFANRKYLRRSDVSHHMKVFSGQYANLSTHSFRIGAATTLANSGYPRWLIQSLGRWSGDCFRTYLRVADSTFSGVPRSLVDEPASGLSYDPDKF